MTSALDDARRLLRTAERIVALTGAGISTDSGIPDFRGPQGVWTKNPEAEKKSNISYYLSDPEVRRQTWQRRVEAIGARREPNPGHRAFVELERWGTLDTLVTQNVDGLHLEAGTSRELLVEIHGTMREYMCLDCDARGPIGDVLDRVRAGEADPPCEVCGGILKSATISFGQGLVGADLARADAASRRADLLLAVGTTLGVYPIANMVPLAKSRGATVIIVNGGPTQMDDLADIVLAGSISELLTALVSEPGSAQG